MAKQPAQGSAKARSLSGSLKKRLRQKTKDAAAALARKEDEVFEAAKGHKHMTKTQKKDMKKELKVKARARAKASRDIDNEDAEDADGNDPKGNEDEKRAWHDIE